VPRSISWLDELPKTGSGKILKRSCGRRSGPIRTSKTEVPDV
jgi:acyl-CoA synthetase (AMP-forming)/AMP-acid ligase II